MSELEKAIDGLTKALISEAPNWEPDVILATARGVLVILTELQKQVSS
jgi:hypothetical protein